MGDSIVVISRRLSGHESVVDGATATRCLVDIPGRTGGRYVAIAILRAVSLEPSPILRGITEVYFSGTQTP